MAASRNPLIRLAHIRDEIAQITATLDGVTYETFCTSYVLRRTAEHAILIVSEAAKALPSTLTDRFPGVDWRAVRTIGNVLRHEYFGVDTRVLWSVCNNDRPALNKVVAMMIADQSPSSA